MNKFPFKYALLGGVCLIASGCSQSATGQVAAVVNGEEITLQEINAELTNANIPNTVDKKVAQQAALQRIVDRRLMSQTAKEEGLDQTPEYFVREHQLKDALLGQMLAQRIERTIKVPDEETITKFIADNKSMFEQRAIYSLDRIQFPLPTDREKLKALENDHSMAAVATTLGGQGIKFSRGPAQADTLQIAPDRVKWLTSIPSGEPFVTVDNGIVSVAVITGKVDQPIAPAQARPIALQALRNQSLGNTMQERLKTARTAAKITYQDGFSPPAKDAAQQPAAQPAAQPAKK